jgi:hypothetical protein
MLIVSLSIEPCSCLRHFSMMAGGIIRGDKIPSLVKLAQETKRGLLTERKNEMLQLLEETVLQNFEFSKRNSVKDSYLQNLVNGKWELLWTTEKETLFFAKNGLFGAECSMISQTIDIKNKKIFNVIDFEQNRKFEVVGDLTFEPTNRQRVNFKFSRAELSFSSETRIPIPPFGQGWFDNLYVNERYRISTDIRGDYLLSRRVS